MPRKKKSKEEKIGFSTRIKNLLGKADKKIININEFLDKSETIKAILRYDAIFRRTKIVGQTDKRSFGFRKRFNRQIFISSNRSISHVEFGRWRIPIWLWALLSITIIIPITAMFNPELYDYAVGAIIFPIIVVLFCIYFRRVTYFGTAIGSHFFHIITRKGNLLDEAVVFLKYIHLNEPFKKPRTEDYVIPDFFARWIRRFILIVFAISLINWWIVLNLIL